MNPRYPLLLLVVCLLVGGVQAWGEDMGAWDYRKEFTINNTGSELTNYQVMFTVNRSAGTDTGFTVYVGTKCESDYDDIRFTKADGTTLLDYWIESSSATVATIWVKVPSLPTGDTTGYLYYGNPQAVSESNGSAVFDFFDDFLGDTLDTLKWDNLTGSGVSISNSIVKATASSNAEYGIQSKNNLGTNIAIRARVYPHDYGDTSKIDRLTIRLGQPGNYCIAFYSFVDVTYCKKYAHNLGGTLSATDILGGSSAWFIQEAKLGSSSAKYTVNNANEVVNSTNYYGDSGKCALTAYASGAVIEMDWILVRKYTATEPTVSAWGSEESPPVVRSIASDFSALPLSGHIPLTVYFTDESTGNNCTVDSWQWSFGDGTPNSTQQNPAHTYTTTGLYTVILTAFNTTFSRKGTEAKTAYINATYDPNAPTADFTVTETCGSIGDTFYFIDFSTGGGLYAWNWSFGDGSYSELRNPTHQYASNGTYSVNLSVWGAYGFDSLLRSNLITVPCGAPTPTPTPTVTPTSTPGNVTEGNATYIYAPDQDYVPFPIWLAIVIVSIALFGHSIIFLRNSDITAMMATVFAFVSAWLSNMIGYIDVQITSYAEEIVISPVIQAVHPPWLVYTMLIFVFVSVVNIFAAIYKVYIKPVPWNEIYDRKLPKWERRK